MSQFHSLYKVLASSPGAHRARAQVQGCSVHSLVAQSAFSLQEAMHSREILGENIHLWAVTERVRHICHNRAIMSLGDNGQCLETFLAVSPGVGMLPSSGGWRPGKLQSILQCTDGPQQRITGPRCR